MRSQGQHPAVQKMLVIKQVRCRTWNTYREHCGGFRWWFKDSEDFKWAGISIERRRFAKSIGGHSQTDFKRFKISA